jgi:hypothetical protein
MDAFNDSCEFIEPAMLAGDYFQLIYNTVCLIMGVPLNLLTLYTLVRRHRRLVHVRRVPSVCEQKTFAHNSYAYASEHHRLVHIVVLFARPTRVAVDVAMAHGSTVVSSHATTRTVFIC